MADDLVDRARKAMAQGVVSKLVGMSDERKKAGQGEPCPALFKKHEIGQLLKSSKFSSLVSGIAFSAVLERSQLCVCPWAIW